MYDYDKMKQDIDMLNPIAADVGSIGESVMGRDIYSLKIGRGKRVVVLTGAHHGLEYITSLFLLKFAREYTDCALFGRQMCGRDVRQLYEAVTLYIIPMVNPDGVDIAVNGLDITDDFHRKLISSVGIHSFRKVWQANAGGVDINHNYDALWQRVIEKPAPSLYGGEYPESEPETAAMCNFLRSIEADILICFHSQGEEIYYDFDGTEEKKAKELADKMADASGYTVAKPSGTASYGGCKDWFIKEFGKAGFTVEVGRGKNPLPLEMIDKIYEDNVRLLFAAIE